MRRSHRRATSPSLTARILRFARAALLRLAAGVAALAAVAGLAAIATFSINDPSFDTATARAPGNLLGLPGAYAADLLLQIFGAMAAFALAPIVLYGGRYAAFRTQARDWRLNALRWAAAPAALAALGAFAAILPLPASWPFAVGLGGVLGDRILSAGAGLLAAASAPGPEIIAGALLGVIGAPLYVFMMGVTWPQARASAAAIARTLAGAGRSIRDGAIVTTRSLAILRARLSGQDAPMDEAREDEDSETGDDFVVERPGLAEPASANGKSRRIIRNKKKASASRRERQEAQPRLDFRAGDDFRLPALHLLAKPDERARCDVNDEALEQNARMLETVLSDFGVRGEIINVRPGPVVTLYELEPAAGVKSSRVIGLADDIARSMSAIAARVAVVPGRNVIGIELPNDNRETVYLRELLSHRDYEGASSSLTLALGKSIGGEPVVADLARMPHLLIAGTTGSGKSVGINSMILSLLYRLSPDECKLIMIDPKMLELSVYDGIPHLLAPVVTDPGKAVVALKWTVREMEQRYRKMSKLGVRNIAGFNQRLEEAEAAGEVPTRTVHTGYDPETGEPIYEAEELDYEKMPFIVVVIDEMADLMMVAGKDIEAAVQRLAQMARAAGIHLIMATQRPSVDVITGTIKANFPTRISFQVTSKIDSRTILGEQGAEQLLGQGDMLYMAGGGRITRVHGPFVSDDEVEKIVKHLKKQGRPEYVQDVTEMSEDDMGADSAFGGVGGSGDSLFDQAVAVVARDRKASTSYIQRRLQIGYNRAATLIERMEDEGMIGPANHAGKREIFLPESAA